MPNFSSFNAFGSAAKTIGQSHVPVWLGVVTPVPVGGTLASDFARANFLLGAGAAVKLANKILTPFVGFEVVSFTAGDGTTVTKDTIVVKPAVFGGVVIAPAVDDVIQKLGATFAATGKAAVVTDSELLTSGDNKGCYEVKVAHSATIDTPSAGDVITFSAAEAAGSSKSIAVIPDGYLYNDIYTGELNENVAATGAVVKFHSEGLLVELTPAAAVKAQMAAAVPGVLQVLV
ncbi:MAG: hypothetical protein IK114_14325 [Fibrobacter sp.]|nr:hypothetical protein [Fibrobacter sp.]